MGGVLVSTDVTDAPTPSDGQTPAQSRVIRGLIEQILERDLLGPWDGPEEELAADKGPRSRYLVGMVAPVDVRADPEEVDAGLGDSDEEGEGVERAAPAAASTMFPRSIGISFAVPDLSVALRTSVTWGRYEKRESETQISERGEPRVVWRRLPIKHEVELKLQSGRHELPRWPEDPNVRLSYTCRPRKGQWVIELALINRQKEPKRNRDEAWLFQPSIVVTATDRSAIFLPQDQAAFVDSDQAEERLLAMLYREYLEFAAGRNVAVAVEREPAQRRATLLRTEWLPSYDVPQTVTPRSADQPLLEGLELDMRTLSTIEPTKLRRALEPLADGYTKWLDGQERRLMAEADFALHRAAAAASMKDARLVAQRIRAGIDLVCRDPEGIALKAFRFANEAMALQRIHTEASRLRDDDPNLAFEAAVEKADTPTNRSWRPFQLAFVLLNLPALTNPGHVERSPLYTAVVDLLFFPTGGGKTEAYLGLSAFTFAVRRFQGIVGAGAEARDGLEGVVVLMRYTLRLLTAQQFQRAASLICACEFLRRRQVAAGDQTLGSEPFRIGLWVGLAVSPNSYDDAAKQIRSARGQGRGTGNQVLQVLNCPWCSAQLTEGRDLEPQDQERRVYIYCSDPEGDCPFSRRQSPGEGLPILTVDEEIYRLAPSMVISTVDKLAQLPWRGQPGMLFGRVSKRCSRHGFRHPDLDARTGCTDSHRQTTRLPAATTTEVIQLRPPDLIIQDELHLISGALGTMVGLYETMVDELCTWRWGADRIRPKIISSTATVRRAREQVHQLFGRDLRVFPPPVLDAGQTFFSAQVPVSANFPGRRYRGICAHGIRLKQAEIRISESLLTTTQYLFDLNGVAGDPYMTLVAYFNALRELAGMKRLVDDDISIRARRGTDKGLANRWVPMEVQELTSRTPSSRIAETLRQLDVSADPRFESTAARTTKPRPIRDGRRPIDVLLATSMLQVGVDVSRLGLMVMTGQPKNTAEYIQATSRVGRDPFRPGLIVTLYNWARPRDLAHYETFYHYHETFYRRVEPLSVTPFSLRAIDRGLTGVLVGMIRNSDMRYSPNPAAHSVDLGGQAAAAVLEAIATRAGYVGQSDDVAQFVREAIQSRYDSWQGRVARLEATRLVYQTGGDAEGLLRESSNGPWDVWTVANSLREAEAEINLILPRASVADPSLAGQPNWDYPGATSEDDPDLEADAPASVAADPMPASKNEL